MDVHTISSPTPAPETGRTPTLKAEEEIHYHRYNPAEETTQLEAIRRMISTDLSEPYSIYVYRYFLYQWGDLCYMVPLPHPRVRCPAR
jgi:hypothetical protein